jgi:hypothetical protein
MYANAFTYVAHARLCVAYLPYHFLYLLLLPIIPLASKLEKTTTPSRLEMALIARTSKSSAPLLCGP